MQTMNNASICATIMNTSRLQDQAGESTLQAPLVQAMLQHADKEQASFHTPGHKGHSSALETLQRLSLDLTELPDIGSLYDGGDVIEQAEELAANAFGAARTLFSSGGCTLCIQTMLLLGVGAGGRVLMARNSHRSAVNAAALLGLEPVWLWPKTTSPNRVEPIAPDDIYKKLREEINIQAVYVTSPDYYGNLCDIQGIAAVCKGAGIPLLVDNAHGSHLGAFSRHPLQLGASMTADSAHKTLPVLTGGAYLHIAKDDKQTTSASAAKAAMALFGSTSPSFPVLASLDAARDWWQQEGKSAYRNTAERVNHIHSVIERSGTMKVGFSYISPEFRDPARLTIDSGNGTGLALAAYFRNCGCEPEYADSQYVVLIPTPFNTEEEWVRLKTAICNYRPFCQEANPPAVFSAMPGSRAPEKVLLPREALLCKSREVSIEDAVGQVAARSVCPCPPGVAVVVPGERIDVFTAKWLKDCGFERILVIENHGNIL